VISSPSAAIMQKRITISDRYGLCRAVDDLLAINARLQLRHIARHLRVDRHSIESGIRQCKGMSFRKYRNQKILELMLRLLSGEPTLSLKEMAFALGYQSPGSLSRFIKAATGKPFREIRQEYATTAKFLTTSAT